ncbi:MAG: calcium/sodium antiporter, partial [Gammaproteobacteria bacterium]|nr:calcium/sodium antiporter [Gammaproteobacteria bacterium]
MIIAILKIIGGLVGLTFGADRFVGGASAVARELKVSPLLIGLTIVAFGTSAPEMLVSASAALKGNPGIALGNAIGSNIANVGLVLGATALVMPLMVQSQTLRKEFPILWLVMLGVFVLMYNLELTFIKGVLMLLGLFAFMAWIVIDGKRSAAMGKPPEILDEVSIEAISFPKAVFWLLVGLVILVLGANILVDGSAFVARSIGISDAVIGLTIVAIGTSLPELAASLAGALKGEPDLAMGNVIGSNVFNLLGVIGIAGVLSPLSFDAELMLRDYSLMLLLTGLLFGLCLWQGRGGKSEATLT